MVYETFDPSGNSIFPAIGGGGLVPFSGPVNPNDQVLLSLYFSNGNVVMYAHDWETDASAAETYAAEGSTYFAGGVDNGALECTRLLHGTDDRVVALFFVFLERGPGHILGSDLRRLLGDYMGRRMGPSWWAVLFGWPALSCNSRTRCSSSRLPPTG